MKAYAAVAVIAALLLSGCLSGQHQAPQASAAVSPDVADTLKGIRDSQINQQRIMETLIVSIQAMTQMQHMANASVTGGVGTLSQPQFQRVPGTGLAPVSGQQGPVSPGAGAAVPGAAQLPADARQPGAGADGNAAAGGQRGAAVPFWLRIKYGFYGFMPGFLSGAIGLFLVMGNNRSQAQKALDKAHDVSDAIRK